MLPALWIIAALTNHGWVYQSDLGTFKTSTKCEKSLGSQPEAYNKYAPKGSKICVKIQL